MLEFIAQGAQIMGRVPADHDNLVQMGMNWAWSGEEGKCEWFVGLKSWTREIQERDKWAPILVEVQVHVFLECNFPYQMRTIGMKTHCHELSIRYISKVCKDNVVKDDFTFF